MTEIERLRAARDAALNAIEDYNVAADAAIAAYLATFDAACKAYNTALYLATFNAANDAYRDALAAQEKEDKNV